MSNEAKFSSNFLLYYGELRMQHTVRTDAGEPTEHAALIESTVRKLLACGHAITESGLEEGTEKQDVTGYVMAEDKDGKPLLFFYCEPLEFRVRGGAVYHEHFSKLPFVPDVSRIWPTSSPPKIEEVQRKGYVHPWRGQILVRKTGKKTDEGHEIWRFSGVAGTPAPVTEQAVAAAAPAVAVESPKHLAQKVVDFVTAETTKTRAQMGQGATRAVQLRAAIGEEWGSVQKAFRSRLISMWNAAHRGARFQEARELAESLAAVLPDGYLDQFLAEVNAAEAAHSAETPVASEPGFDDVPF